MSVKHGTTSITAANHGNTTLQKINHGSTEVFTAGVKVTLSKPAGVSYIYYQLSDSSPWVSTSATSTVVTCQQGSVIRVYVVLTSSSIYQSEMTSESPHTYYVGTSAMQIIPIVVKNPTINITKKKTFGSIYSYTLNSIVNGDRATIHLIDITNASGSQLSLNTDLSSGATYSASTSLGTKSGSVTITLRFWSSQSGSSATYSYSVTP